MNRGLVFFLGFIAGVSATFVTIFFLYPFMVLDSSVRQSSWDPVDEVEVVEEVAVDSVVIEGVAVVENDSIEVKGRNGYVNLAVGMSKSDVRSRLGRPKSTNYSYGTETWRYEFPGQGMYGTTRVLSIEFNSHGLKSISDY